MDRHAVAAESLQDPPAQQDADVFTDKRQAEFQKYRQKLRTEAIIEWKNPDLKRAYEQGLAKQGKPAQ